MPSTIDQIVSDISEILIKRDWKIVTAESCTGGGLAFSLTKKPGSSRWFERGFVVYSNPSKEELLNVSSETLLKFGAVSRETAIEMAQGALNHSKANVSIAITGIAGPTGGTADKPVGTVWIAWGLTDQKINCEGYHFPGDRRQVRQQAIQNALEKLLIYLR